VDGKVGPKYEEDVLARGDEEWCIRGPFIPLFSLYIVET
jgi:hypothetical protein